MKKILALTFVAVLSLSVSLQAQKIKKEVVGKYSYTQLPIDISLQESKTYKVDGHGDYVDSYMKDKMSGAFNLKGFEKQDRNADDVDFKIDVEMYALKFGDSEKKTSTKTKKVDGVEKKYNVYYYTCKATYKFVIRIYKDGSELYKTESAGTESVSGSTKESSSAAWESFKSAKSSYKSNVISNKLKGVNTSFNEKYCILTKTASLRSAHMKPKKHSYEDYDKVFEFMKEGYLTVAADENEIEGAKENLTKAIEGFTEILKESDPDNKKARINNDITALLYMNIAHCYFLMKDYPKASENYTNCMEYKKGLLDAKALKAKSENLHKRVEANKAS